MTNRSPMHQQIDTLPDLVRDIVKPFDASARSAFDFETCTSVKRIYLVGCGDSHHAPLGAIVGQFKSIVTKQSQFIPTPPTHPIWQRNYYDHIIRSAASLEKIRQYIIENPARWADDDLYIG